MSEYFLSGDIGFLAGAENRYHALLVEHANGDK
ncbi:MAG: hypothetical protein ACI9B9_000422 [Halioglobus sp.]|jgi:hypothetical protein